MNKREWFNLPSEIVKGTAKYCLFISIICLFPLILFVLFFEWWDANSKTDSYITFKSVWKKNMS